MVRLSKPAHWGDPAITNKTGGGNSEASVLERMFADAPERVRQVNEEKQVVLSSTQNQLASWYEKG
jgi:hypothetical protein